MSWLFGKRTNVTTAADKIAAFQSTTCDFGTPLALVFGTARRGPNLINYQDFYAEPIVTKQKTGKRSSATQIDYKYHAYIELALCEGVIDGIGRIWIGDKTYASLAAFNAEADCQGAPLSLNKGNISSPTAYMASHHSDIAVGYSNMAFLYGYVYLGLNNASIPSYGIEILGLLRNSGDGTDANPASVISFLLTLLGYENNIDSTSFNDFWQYCSEADILISTPQDAFTSQKKCQEVIKELLTLTNTYMFWSVDKFKFVPRDTMPRGQWVPHTIGSGPHLTPDDMGKQSDGACVVYERKDSSEVYNRFGVVFTSRANGYEAETVFYEDTNDIAVNGIKSAPDLDAKWLHTVERAVTVAEMRARINRTENIKYTFKLSWAFAYLEPGDLVTLTDPVIGLNQQLVMIETVTEQADETLIVTALRRDGVAVATYNTGSDSYNEINNNKAPGNTRAPVMFEPPAELATSNNFELWIALQGGSVNWGGCSVYANTQDSAYELIGTHNRHSNYGKIITALSASGTTVDIEFSNVNTVELPAGSAQDAADGLCNIYIDGEFCAYTNATLIGTKQYRLTLLRGRYGSTAAAHSVNAKFAMMDENLYCLIVPKSAAGKTMYMKFPAFNVLGLKSQDLADVDYYTHTFSNKSYEEEYTEDNFVDQQSADYIKSAVVSNHVLTLSTGSGQAIVFNDTTYTDGDGLTLTGNTFALATSGAIVGSYGQSENASPSAGGTFKIPYITVDEYGRATAISEKTITLPSAYELPIAGSDTLGGIKVGDNLSITEAGVLSATDTTYSDFVGSGPNAAHGLVPVPPNTAGTTKYLREDGTWYTPPGTEYSDFVGSGPNAAHGLVPAPDTTAGTSKYLREDGSWFTPPGTTYQNMTAVELNTGTGTTGRVLTAQMLSDYLNGTCTVERDENGDFMPKVNPHPSLFFDVDENGDIMPRKTNILFDGHGDIMPT